MKNILNANRKFSSREYYTILYYTNILNIYKREFLL